MSEKYIGVQIIYQGNVLYCNRHRTAEENEKECKRALCSLLGMSQDELFGNRMQSGQSIFELYGGKIRHYRTTGESGD